MQKIMESFITVKNYIVKFLIWLLLSVSIGALCGLCGALFSKTIGFVTELRAANWWLLLLLPIGGLISVGVYKLCRVSEYGTIDAIESARTEKKLPFYLAPAIFIGTAISHLFGASAGREGAALQLGGSIASLFSKIFKLKEESRRIIIMCGMAALFSSVFGTPLAACIFVLEVVMTDIFASAILLILVSSITAFKISTLLGVTPEYFELSNVPDFNFNTLWRVSIIIFAGIIVAFIFMLTIHKFKQLFEKLFKNPFIRIAVGGAVIVALTFIVGNIDYNGGGIEIINRIFTDGTVRYEAFALKILFTAITIAAGFKGGEIIPTLFIGATYGGALAMLLGMSPAFGAAIGMAVLFSGVTKCPIATIFLCAEMFGGKGMLFITTAIVISYFFSKYAGIYNKSK